VLEENWSISLEPEIVGQTSGKFEINVWSSVISSIPGFSR
jgi:hypothetical protein